MEPAEGIPYFQKYEMRLMNDRRFKTTDYKSSEVMDFQIVLKYFKILQNRRLGKGTRLIKIHILIK